MKFKLVLSGFALTLFSAGGLAQGVSDHALDYIQEKAEGYKQELDFRKSFVTPQAYVNGNLLLRDAIYRYHEQIVPTGNEIIFLGGGCDIYQLVLTVLRGSVTLLTLETSGTSQSAINNGLGLYPDKIGVGAGMFSYTLYSNNTYKGFLLKNGDYVGDNEEAEVTAFGYCFSTKIYAESTFMNTYGNTY